MDKERASLTEETFLPEATTDEPQTAPEPPADGEKDTEAEDNAGTPIPASIGCTVFILAVVISFFSLMLPGCPANDAASLIVVLFLLGIFVLAPACLTMCNILLLFLPTWRFVSERGRKLEQAGRWLELITILWGWICTLLWAGLHFSNTRWVDWQEQLYNGEVHSPIAMDTVPTLVTLILLSTAGYAVLRLVKQEKLPPLVSALSIAALYIGGAECVVWIMQVLPGDPVLCVLPFNIILIYAKVMRDAVIGWRKSCPEAAEHRSAFVRFFARMMNNSLHWPWLALVLAVPLLGIVIALLTLFGQAPDSIIQAWAQTGDWTFSQQVSPQNLHYDEHYLCTVAAGGHKRVVKPLRRGKRRGHDVIVNRQLCVANAFEQLIEERTPRFHSLVRGVYDKYGYPIARHIKTPLAADAVWVLMKPLEWLFLAVLYLFDRRPENRIAVQYPHAPLPDIEKRDEI